MHGGILAQLWAFTFKQYIASFFFFITANKKMLEMQQDVSNTGVQGSVQVFPDWSTARKAKRYTFIQQLVKFYLLVSLFFPMMCLFCSYLCFFSLFPHLCAFCLLIFYVRNLPSWSWSHSLRKSRILTTSTFGILKWLAAVVLVQPFTPESPGESLGSH